MKIYYRLSDGSYPKVRFQNATKENCFKNFLRYCLDDADQLFVYADNVTSETWHNLWLWIDGRANITRLRSAAGSSAASFRLVLGEALKGSDEEIVWFQEDDYAHLPGSRTILLEGLERADYVTLYTHPDKFIPASKGGNPLIGDDAAEETKVFVTKSSYWMMTNSTTMTFATQVRTLREDQALWWKYTEGNYPQDMQIFLELRQRGRGLIQPIPTKATHCEPKWAAHLFGTGYNDWERVLSQQQKRYLDL